MSSATATAVLGAAPHALVRAYRGEVRIASAIPERGSFQDPPITHLYINSGELTDNQGATLGIFSRFILVISNRHISGDGAGRYR